MGPITNTLWDKIQYAQGIIALYGSMSGRRISLRGLFSGGKDSTVASHLATTHPNWRGVAHIRTMTGPASIRHSNSVEQQAKERGWNWIEAHPATTLPALVAMFGFPGPAMHNIAFRYLKERPIRQLAQMARRQDKSKRVVWVSGVRAAESASRAKKSEERTVVSDAEWFINPILDWSDSDVRDYLDAYDLDVLAWDHSLDCYCGAYAVPGDELALIKSLAPDQYEYIKTLEVLAQAARQLQLLNASVPGGADNVIPESMCQWGHGLNTKTRTEKEPNVMLCANCGAGQLETLLDALKQKGAQCMLHFSYYDTLALMYM